MFRIDDKEAGMLVRTPDDFGNLVRERRNNLQLTQEDLAKEAGVSRTWLVAVEAGHARAELGKLLRVVLALGMDLALSVPPPPDDNLDNGVDLDELLGAYGRKNRDRP